MNDQQKDKLERAKLIRETTGARLVDVLHLMTVFETDEQVTDALTTRLGGVSTEVQLFVLKKRVDALTEQLAILLHSNER